MSLWTTQIFGEYAVVLYILLSFDREGAKKHAAEQQNYCEKDYRVRFDSKKLLEIVKKDLQLRSATVYGSLSAEVANTVFDQNWKKKMFPRSPIDNREKQVDSSMTVAITRTAMKEPGCTIVILSGDADFLPAIEAALNQRVYEKMSKTKMSNCSRF